MRYLFFVFLFSEVLAQKNPFTVKRLLVNGKELSPSSTPIIQLKSSQNEVLAEATLLPADSVWYEHRLMGLDSHWVKTTYPAAHYQQLNGGSYLLQIRACTAVSSPVLLTLPIQVQQSFWEEWWFWPMIITYILFVISLGIYLFFLYNFKQKLKVQTIRNQIAADLHDEVGSNLNSIAIFAEVLRKKTSTDTLPILERIIDNTKESVGLMQDAVWAINPKNDSNEKLFERMRSFASALLTNKGIAFDFEIQENIQKADFTLEQRKNCYLIFKEAINNIAKHSHANKASVKISSVPDCFYLTIEDNGRGFDATADHAGNGVSNFKNRAEEAEMFLDIQSTIGQGTVLHLEIPIL
jgi:nitrate/nitrite-specific signal transduction histidine kinase